MPKEPMKKRVIDELVAQLEKEKLVYERISAQARLDAIDGEMKQEGKYDTRAIEASYLAGAQQRRLEEIILEIQNLKLLEISAAMSSVAVGALVKVEGADSAQKWYFISPSSGGAELSVGAEVKVVSVKSPIGQALVGLVPGEEPQRQPLPQPLRDSTVVEIL